MSYEDADIVEALQALESQIPDGYFEGFSRKVAARLEVDSMQQSDVNAGGPASGLDDAWVAASATAKPKQERDENSGLHEIKELATTAKRRISSRMSSQGDAEEALLASSSSGLHAVVLPEPGKETQGDVVSLRTAERAAATETPAPQARSGGISPAVWAAVGTLAIAAAVVVFIVVKSGAGSDAGESTVAANSAGAKASQDQAAELTQPEPAAPSVEPIESDTGANAGDAPPPADETEAADDDGAPAVADNNKGHDEGDDSETRAAAGAPSVARRAPSADSKAEEKAEHKRSRAREDRAAKSKSDKDHDKAKDKAKKNKPESSKTDSKNKPGEKADMDDLLNSVTGGIEEEKQVEKEKKPSKKSLDRGDVASAMGAIRGRATACHEKEGATGQVKIRFTVAPSGKVSSAKAKGKFAGTPTGSCVARAVKGAKFPAFDGRPMSFTFPFLLSQ